MSNNSDTANPNPWTPWGLLAVLAIVVLFVFGGARSCSSTVTSSARPTQVVVTVTITHSVLAAPTAGTGSRGTGPGTGQTSGGSPSSDTGETVVPGLSANGAPIGPGALAQYQGERVLAADVPVQAVPALNGFWIGTSTMNRIWVQLVEPGQVYPHAVQAGDHLSFVGRLVVNPAGFAANVGVCADEGAAQLTEQGWHVETDKSGLSFG